MESPQIEQNERISVSNDGVAGWCRHRRTQNTSTLQWSLLLLVASVCCQSTLRVTAFAPLQYRPISRLQAPSVSHRTNRLRVLAQSTTISEEAINGDTTATTIVTPDDEAFYVSGIQPKTMTLPHSMEFYARFVIQRMHDNRQQKLLEKDYRRGWKFWKKVPPTYADGTPRGTLWDTIQILNAQRRSVVKLAGYNAPLVVPSFVFLLLGAFMMSVIPHFYSVCIQYVATNEPSRLKCIRALSGLAITSTLGALFTGLRGSLFWIAGSRANYNVRSFVGDDIRRITRKHSCGLLS